MMRKSVLLLAFVCAACALSTEDKIALACQTYASSLATLSMAKAAGDLSTDQIAAVNDVREVVNPVCLDGDWTSADRALADTEAGIAELAAVERNL